MGREALCRLSFDDRVSDGEALLETEEIIFRGDFRLRIPLKAITNLVEQGDSLRVEYEEGLAVLEIGARNVASWAAAIRNPRGLIDKLGVKTTWNIAVLGVEDEEFLRQLQERGSVVSRSLTAASDVVFYEADALHDLGRLSELKDSIKPDGAIWVVSPKGKQARLKDTDVMAAARAAGLVDTKVVSFSDSHMALKLVIPKAQR